MYNSNDNDEKTKEINTIKSNENNISKKSVVAGEEIELEYTDYKREDTNRDINEEVKVKKLINKKIIIGIICIIAVIVCVIVYSVFTRNNSKVETKDQIEDERDLLVSTKDTYEGLNYEIEKIYTEQIGFFYDYSRGLEGKKIEISYLKVNGLKDEELENKINELLKDVADELYTKENIQDEGILYDHVYNATNVYVFNNVLSTLYCKETCDVEGNITYKYKGVNINLKEFEEIELKDVFLNTTDIESLMSENMKQMYNKEEFEFSISPKFVYIPVSDGKIEKINFYDNKEEVAIYKRYTDNKKMFIKTYNANPYVFTTKNFFEADIYGIVEDTLFIDTHNMLVNSNYNDKVKNAAYNLYKQAVNKASNLTYSNPSKRYLVQIVPYVELEEENIYNIKVEYNAYEIDKEFFNNNIIEFVVACENKEGEEVNKVKYFSTPIKMDAQMYLKDEITDILTLKVDENGVEINQNNIIEDNQGNVGIS